MYKFKIKLLYKEEELFRSITELLNLKLILPSAETVMVWQRLAYGLFFSGNAPVHIQLVVFLLLLNIIVV